MKFVANCWVEVDDVQVEGFSESDLRDYLVAAASVDIDVENEGSVGVESIEIDWDSLRPA
jgi:hypothetical protein